MESKKFIRLDGKLYPCDQESRADVLEGHSQPCPMPMGCGLAYEFNEVAADNEIRASRAEYCWRDCYIFDCPSVLANKD